MGGVQQPCVSCREAEGAHSKKKRRQAKQPHPVLAPRQASAVEQSILQVITGFANQHLHRFARLRFTLGIEKLAWLYADLVKQFLWHKAPAATPVVGDVFDDVGQLQPQAEARSQRLEIGVVARRYRQPHRSKQVRQQMSDGACHEITVAFEIVDRVQRARLVRTPVTVLGCVSCHP